MGQYWPGMYKGQGPKRYITGDIQIFLKKTKEKKCSGVEWPHWLQNRGT